MVARKKNLSDLVRQELQKTPEVQVENVPVIEQNLKVVAAVETTPTESEQLAIIQQLKDSLQAAQKAEASLKEEVKNLRSSVDQHQKLVAELETELETAKSTALELAKSNSQLIAEIDNIKKENANLLLKEKSQNLPVLAQQKRHNTPVVIKADNDFTNNIHLY